MPDTPETPMPKKGWHPDPGGSDKLRWWDGEEWTENLQEPPPAPEPKRPATALWTKTAPEPDAPERPTAAATSPPSVAAQTAPAGAEVKKPWWRRTWVLVAAGIVALLIVVGSLIPEDNNASKKASPAAAGKQVPADPVAEVSVTRPADGGVVRRHKFALTGTATPGTTVEVDGRSAKVAANGSWTRTVTADIGPNGYTVTATGAGYQDAAPTEVSITRKRTAAERAGLRAALARARAKAKAEAEARAARRAAERAARAARRAGRRALQSAQDYLASSAFSKQGLYEQLTSSAGEGFTPTEAQYAVDHVNVDWNQEAVESARQYLATSSFSRSGLIEQLSSSAGEGFTYAQALYAVNKVY